MNKLLYPLLCICVLLSCTSKMMQNSDTSLRNQLIGQWRNVTLHVDVNTANNTEKDIIFESNEFNWEKDLKIKPIRTYFNKDNTFYSEYYNLKDSLIYHPTGKWSLSGEQLTFYYEKPRVDTLLFTLKIKDDIATFEGMLDWDSDGKKDDHYLGTQRKQK